MSIQVDIWGGDLHQNLVSSEHFEEWPEAVKYIQATVEVGLLCNVLHTDFKTPAHRAEEQAQAMRKYLD